MFISVIIYQSCCESDRPLLSRSCLQKGVRTPGPPGAPQKPGSAALRPATGGEARAAAGGCGAAPAAPGEGDSLPTGDQMKAITSARTQVMPPHSHTTSRARSRPRSVQFLPQPLGGTVFPFQCSILPGKGCDFTAVRCELEDWDADFAQGMKFTLNECHVIHLAGFLYLQQWYCCDLKNDDICCSMVTSSTMEVPQKKRTVQIKGNVENSCIYRQPTGFSTYIKANYAFREHYFIVFTVKLCYTPWQIVWSFTQTQCCYYRFTYKTPLKPNWTWK